MGGFSGVVVEKNAPAVLCRQVRPGFAFVPMFLLLQPPPAVCVYYGTRARLIASRLEKKYPRRYWLVCVVDGRENARMQHSSHPPNPHSKLEQFAQSNLTRRTPDPSQQSFFEGQCVLF